MRRYPNRVIEKRKLSAEYRKAQNLTVEKEEKEIPGTESVIDFTGITSQKFQP